MAVMPERPVNAAFQNSEMPIPIGETMPSPVTTTRAGMSSQSFQRRTARVLTGSRSRSQPACWVLKNTAHYHSQADREICSQEDGLERGLTRSPPAKPIFRIGVQSTTEPDEKAVFFPILLIADFQHEIECETQE